MFWITVKLWTTSQLTLLLHKVQKGNVYLSFLTTIVKRRRRILTTLIRNCFNWQMMESVSYFYEALNQVEEKRRIYFYLAGNYVHPILLMFPSLDITRKFPCWLIVARDTSSHSAVDKVNWLQSVFYSEIDMNIS